MKRWKDAVNDAGVVHWTLTDETANDPRKAIGALLDTVSNIALDPAVSSDAAKLRDTYLHRAERAEHELEAARADAELWRENAKLLDTLCRNLAGSWLYGKWNAETYSEREQERVMRSLGWWPITEDELVARGAALDAARKENSNGN